MQPKNGLLIEEDPGTLLFGGARMALMDVEAALWGLRRHLEALTGRQLADAVFQQAGANGGASFARAFTPDVVEETAVSALRDCVAAYQAAGFGRFEITDVRWPLGRVCVQADHSFEAWSYQQHKQPVTKPVCAYSAGVLVGFVNALTDRRDIVCVERTCQALGDDHCRFELLPAADAAETAVVAIDPDPFLSHQLNLLDILFDRMPMGIVIFDHDLRIRRFNPTWANFIDRYTPASAAQVAPGVGFFDLLPDVEDNFGPLFERVLAGETIQVEALPSTSGGITSYWDVVFSPLLDNGKVVGVLDVVIDATERQQTLVELQQSEAHLRSMLDSAQGYAIYRIAVDAANPYYGEVVLVSPSIQDVVGIENPYQFASWFENIHPDDIERVVAANRRAMQDGQPFDETLRLWHKRKQDWRWVHTVSMPVFAEDGMLTHFNGITMDVTEQKQAEQALAEVNLMLEQKVEERTQELSTLLAASQNVASTLELEPLLGQVLDQLNTVVGFDGASILELTDNELRLLAYRGPIPKRKAGQIRFSLAEAGANQAVIERRRPVIVPDVYADTPLARAFRETADQQLATTFGYVRSWMGAPLIVRGQVLGMLSLDHGEADFYDERSAALVQAFANQVSVFIDNGRLYTETRRTADEVRTLFNVQQAINSRLDTDVVLQMIADEACRLTETKMAAVYLLTGDELEIRVVSGDVDAEMVGYRLPVAGSIAGQVVEEKRPFLITDAAQENRVHQALTRAVGADAFVIVPLLSGGAAIGTITVANKQSGSLGADDERILTMMAAGAVIALENARSYEAEQARRYEAERRRQVAEGLRDILGVLNSTQPLQQVLDYIVLQASELMGPETAVAIFRFEGEEQRAVLAAHHQLISALADVQELPGAITGLSAFREQKPVVMADVAAYTTELYQLAENEPQKVKTAIEMLEETYQSYLAVPLVIRDDLYGGMAFHYRQRRKFSDEDISLALALGDQAALAIENARLRDEAEQIAVVAERNRLARELHDAVTQTLFSASLIADVLPRIWERDQEMGQARLAELRELTRGALAEMRTLLLELRPATLTESSLSELLRQLKTAVVGRSRLPVALTVRGERPLPPEVQVVLYRIAQEALNNVIKHAGADEAAITLQFDDDGVLLTVVDNGRGFDAASMGMQSMGLSIMRERSEKIDADLQIESTIGQGTAVRVRVSGV